LKVETIPGLHATVKSNNAQIQHDPQSPSYDGHIHRKTLMIGESSSTSNEQVRMPRDLDFGIWRLAKRTSGDI